MLQWWEKESVYHCADLHFLVQNYQVVIWGELHIYQSVYSFELLASTCQEDFSYDLPYIVHKPPDNPDYKTHGENALLKYSSSHMKNIKIYHKQPEPYQGKSH